MKRISMMQASKPIEMGYATLMLVKSMVGVRGDEPSGRNRIWIDGTLWRLWCWRGQWQCLATLFACLASEAAAGSAWGF